MGKRKKKMEESLNLSASTATSQGDEVSIKSLAESISLILETVKGNTATLESLKSNIKAIEDNVKKLEEIVSESSKEVAKLIPRVQNVELETASFKNQISVLAEENIALKSHIDNMSLTLMKLESNENDKHLVMWNVKVQDEIRAQELLSKVVIEGLDLPAPSPVKLVDFRENAKFLKFELPSRLIRNEILKNAKKLKNKKIGGFEKIYLTDDAPKSVREVRKRLLHVKLKLHDFGIDSWLSKGVPPCLVIKRRDGPNERLTVSEGFALITDLERKHGGRIANMDT